MGQAKAIPAQELSRIAQPEFPWLDTQSLQLMALYISELLAWNTKVNLIGKQDWLSVYQFLIKDSLYLAELLPQLDLPPYPLGLDLGAGAGLPGIPLRIVWPPGEYILVEPRQKRGLFLHHTVRTLSLPRTYIRICRTQDLEQPQANLILSRAMCSWTELLPLVKPMLRPQGRVVTFSNQSWDPGQSCPSGWMFHREIKYPIDQSWQRYFWVFSPIT